MKYHRSKREVLNAYTAVQLADIMGVSVRTAQRYQSGDSQPPSGLLEYVRLTYEQRIMPDSWPEHIRFRGDQITGFDTHRQINWASIGQLDWIMNQWSAACDRMRELELELRELRQRENLPPVDYQKLDAARAELIERGRSAWRELQQKEWYRQDGC